MAHRCTGCGRTFENGSKEMLTGCPDCGGNAFQYVPDGGTAAEGKGMASESTPNGESTASTVASSTSAASAAERASPTPSVDTEPNAPVEDASQADARSGVVDTDELTDREWPAVGRPESERSPTEPESTSERSSSESTRSDPPEPVADTGETTADPTADTADPTTDASEPTDRSTESGAPTAAPEPTEPSPDVEEVRTELNDQFESIRIVEPGQYELNLMELYERDEYIIQLQENGRYVIEALDGWQE